MRHTPEQSAALRRSPILREEAAAAPKDAEAALDRFRAATARTVETLQCAERLAVALERVVK